MRYKNKGEKEKLKVLFIAGCPVTREILTLIIKELQKIPQKNVHCKMLNTYKIHQTFSYNPVDKRVFMVKEILEREKPEAVVVGDDGDINATFIKVANYMNIPTIAVQVGMLSEKKNMQPFDFLRKKNYLLWRMISRISRKRFLTKLTLWIGWRTRSLDWGLSGARKYAVIGEYFRELLMKRGVPRESIVVTGYVLFDNLKMVPPHVRKNVLEKLGLDSEDKLILVATQPLVEDKIWSEDQFKYFSQLLVDATSDWNECKCYLILKPHPREDPAKYFKYFGGNKKVIIVDKNANLTELILASDVVVTVQSTTGLWAIALKKPLIILELFPCHYENILETCALTVHNSYELNQALKQIINGPKILFKNYEYFIKKYLFKIDGKSAYRVMNLIYKEITCGR